MTQSDLFQVGDEVYCPELGGEIYLVESATSDNGVLQVTNSDGNTCKFLANGETFGRRCVWAVTIKNYFALITLFPAIEFSPVGSSIQSPKPISSTAVKRQLPANSVRINGLYKPAFKGKTPEETWDIVAQAIDAGESSDQTYERIKHQYF